MVLAVLGSEGLKVRPKANSYSFYLMSYQCRRNLTLGVVSAARICNKAGRPL
jgi:hypothetical protein